MKPGSESSGADAKDRAEMKDGGDAEPDGRSSGEKSSGEKSRTDARSDDSGGRNSRNETSTDARTRDQSDSRTRESSDTKTRDVSRDRNDGERTGGERTRQESSRESTRESSTETRGNGRSAERGSSRTSVSVSTEQRSTIRNTIISSGGARKVPRSRLGDVRVSVGVSVPREVTIERLPPKIVEIVPEYRDYSYFVTDDDEIAIVDPDTYEIVYVIEA